MDYDTFFARLHGRFHIHFPCHALLTDDLSRFVTEPAGDGTNALVLLTDDDLLRRYREAKEVVGTPVEIPDAPALGRLIRQLPADDVTHVTFDPSPTFHRRFTRRLVLDAAAPAKAG